MILRDDATDEPKKGEARQAMGRPTWRLRPAEILDFPSLDEQLWPIYAAFVILAAFLIGVIQAFGSFQELNPLRNPATGIMAVVVGACVCMAWIRSAPPSRMRRATWLAAVWSLTIHLIVLVLFDVLHIFPQARSMSPTMARQADSRETTIIPDYALPVIEPDRYRDQPFDQPLQAELGEDGQPLFEPERELATNPALDTATPSESSREQPRRFHQHDQIARVEPRSTMIHQTDNSADHESMLNVQKRQHDGPPPGSARAIANVADASSAAVRHDANATSIHEISRSSQDQSLHLADRPTELADSSPLKTVRSLPTRSRATEGFHLDSMTPDMPLPQRRLVPPMRTTVATSPVEVPQAESIAEVADTAVLEHQARTHANQEVNLPREDLPRQSGPVELASPVMARAESAPLPTLVPQQPTRDPLRRSRRVADADQSPRDIAMPVLTDVHHEHRPEVLEPARTALAQASNGTAGMGRDSGFAEQEEGARMPSQLAMNSAVRRADHAQETGQSLSSSEPVPIPHRRADDRVPVATLPAQPVQVPNAPASQQLADRVADSGAVATRMSASQKEDPLSHTVGSSDFDTGIPRMASDKLLDRSAGGGQPEINAQMPQSPTERQQRARSPSTALAAVEPNVQPVAELGQGGGRPIDELVDPAAWQLQRSRHGPQSVSVGPNDGELASDVGSPAQAPQTAPVRLATSGSSPAESDTDIAASPRPLARLARQSDAYRANQLGEVAMPAGFEEPVPMDPVVRTASLGRSRGVSTNGLPATAASEVGTQSASQALSELSGTNWSGPSRRTSSDSVPMKIISSSPPQRDYRRRSMASLRRPSPTILFPSPAYTARLHRRQVGLGSGRAAPIPNSEQAIESGLTFLARVQGSDGRWSLHAWGQGLPAAEREIPALRSDTAATGLALLAFLGAGYHHHDASESYSNVVARGLEFLLRNQAEDGNLFIAEDELSNRSVAFYSHAIGSLALAEAYGMTNDPALRGPARRALDYISHVQHPDWGGWRYSPGISADTSVSGWMLLALRSGELAGLPVPEPTYQGIDRWLDAAQASDDAPHLYRYNPFAPNTESQRHGRRPTHTMTSVGLLMRVLRGANPHQPVMDDGADYLLKTLPTRGTRSNGLRDTYYWYYATQFMFYRGGKDWQRWNSALHPLLIEDQVTRGAMAGSWDPLGPVPDRWGPQAGRIYVTTMNLLSLEVYYRHLPLYQQAGDGQ